jgi:hypothetical protein
MEIQKNQVLNLSSALSIERKITNNLACLLIACLMTIQCSYKVSMYFPTFFFITKKCLCLMSIKGGTSCVRLCVQTLYLLVLWLLESIANIVPSSYGPLIVFTYFVVKKISSLCKLTNYSSMAIQ